MTGSYIIHMITSLTVRLELKERLHSPIKQKIIIQGTKCMCIVHSYE